MNDEPRRDPEEQDFENSVRRRLQAIRQGRGPCPPAEALTAYVNGELSPDESSRIEEHITVCGLCDCIVERVRGGFEDSTQKEAQPLPPELLEAEQRLSGRFRNVMESGNAGGGGQHGTHRLLSLRVFWNPWLAYAVAGAVLLLGYLGIFPNRQKPREEARPQEAAAPQAPPAIMGSLRGLILDRSREPATPLQLTDRDQFFFLSFAVPIRPGFRYEGRITGATGHVVVGEEQLVSYDGIGNFLLVYNRRLFAHGRYTLTVTETGTQTGQAGRSFEFRFSL